MPTYDYKCDACGHAFEQFQSMSAEPIRKCPACKKNKVKRLIGTGAGLIFKGSGFYITDYRDQSYKDKAKAESGSAETKAGGNGNGEAAKGDSSSSTPDTAKPAAEAKPAAPAPAKTESKPASKGPSKKK
jgi:putative FmdB family regulatory protein